MSEQPEQFKGWAIVELFGHGKEIGYVTTRYFGTACLFQVDVPALAEREFTLTDPQYVNGRWTPAGAKVHKPWAPPRTRMVGPGSIFALNPCTEEAAMAAIERLGGREIVILELPQQTQKLIAAGFTDGGRCCEDCGHTPEDGHSESCSFAEIE